MGNQGPVAKTPQKIVMSLVNQNILLFKELNMSLTIGEL